MSARRGGVWSNADTCRQGRGKGPSRRPQASIFFHSSVSFGHSMGINCYWSWTICATEYKTIGTNRPTYLWLPGWGCLYDPLISPPECICKLAIYVWCTMACKTLNWDTIFRASDLWCCDDDIDEQHILRSPAITLPAHRAMSNARFGRLQGVRGYTTLTWSLQLLLKSMKNRKISRKIRFFRHFSRNIFSLPKIRGGKCIFIPSYNRKITKSCFLYKYFKK